MIDGAVAVFLAFATSLSYAALESEGAPEPTVNVVWVGVFLVLFVAICVMIGVAVWRAERRNKANGGGNSKS